MRKYDLNNLLIVLLLALMAATLSGLGNAAYDIKRWYWIPFVLNAVLYISLCVAIFKRNDKPKSQDTGGAGAAVPSKGENVKEDTIADGKPRDQKTGRYIKVKEDKAK
jgi:hypothetical protein